jgi:hypothetical protein
MWTPLRQVAGWLISFSLVRLHRMVFSTSSIDEDAAVLLGLSIVIASSDAGKRLRSHPSLQSVSTEPVELWEFFITSAALATGMAMYQLPCGQPKAASLTSALLRATAHWPNSTGVAIPDFQRFMNRVAEEGVHPHTTLGWWVVWNVKGAALSDQELAAVPPVGALVFDRLATWKDTCDRTNA